MDLGELGDKFIPIIAIVLLLAVNIFLRKRRKEGTPSEICTSLLIDINYNQKLAERFQFDPKVSKFKTDSWQRNLGKIDFLDPALQSTLASTFSMADSSNRDIEAAKRYKTSSYLSGIDVLKLKEYLAKSKQGLEAWFQTNTEQPQPSSRPGGLLR